MSERAMAPSPLLAAALRLEEAKKWLVDCIDEIDFDKSVMPVDGIVCVETAHVAA